MRVLLINQYSMEEAYELWEMGRSGSHHVWGKVELDQRGGIDMMIIPHVKYPFINKIGGWIKIRHLDQQIRVLMNLKKFDILYSPYSTANTRLLVFLKWLGIFRKPIVVCIHQTAFSASKSRRIGNWFAKKFLLQYDLSIFLSRKLMENTIEKLGIPAGIARKKFATAQWGPDINFYPAELDPPLEDCHYFISAGHTARDYDTLVEAFRGIDYPLKIFGPVWTLPKTTEIPENVTFETAPLTYYDLLVHYRAARAIMIPLRYPPKKEGCQGMTSLQDVIALGKPTVMTYNRTLNLDIEKEGFGFAVEMGDVEGWRRAVQVLIDDEKLVKEMGRKAKKTFLEKSNSKIFADRLEELLKKVYREKVVKV